MEDGEGIDLLQDVPDVDGRSRRSPSLHLVAQGSQIIGADFDEKTVLERRQDVAIDDALAHRAGGLSHACVHQPAVSHVAEGLRGGQASLLALFFVGWRFAPGDSPIGVQPLFARQDERYAGRAVPAQGEGLAAAVETLVVTESDGACRRYRHVHAVTVGSRVGRGFGLEVA